MQKNKYGVGLIESIRGKTSSISLLVIISIFIFVKVLEKLSQKAYFRSCDRNTVMSLANKRELDDLGVSCALLKGLICMLSPLTSSQT